MKLQHRLLMIGVGVCCILALIQSIPLMAWSFYMINATHLLKVYSYSDSMEQLYIPLLENTADLDKILTVLEKARQWRSHNPIAYRWLIKTNAVRQNWQSASNVADMAVRELTPDSGLQKNEIAVSYLYRIGQQQICDETVKLSFTNLDRWIESENDLNEFANTLVYQGQPLLARGAYCIADQLYGAKNSPDVTFRDAVLAIMVKQSDAQDRLHATKINDSVAESYILNGDSVIIPGSALSLMTPVPFYNVRFGTNLGTADTEIGVFWWSGQAIAIVDVQHPGEFEINVNVRDSDPAPTRMALGINGQREHYFELTTGDNTWHTISFTSSLEQGLYCISIWFLNNEVIGEKDRDGAVQWLQIQPTGIMDETSQHTVAPKYA